MKDSMTRSTFVLLVSLLAACSNVPQTSVMKTSQPLDPEFYREEIVLLDAAVFVNGPLDENHQMEVIVGLDRLMRSVRLDDEAPATADTLMEALGNLYARVAMADTSATTMEQSGIPEEWSRIRDTYFGDAKWFRQSPSDPVDDLRNVPPTDPAVAFSRPGIRANSALAEGIYKLMMLAGADQKDLRVNKEEELAKLEQLFTAPSPIADSNFVKARSEALQSIHILRQWMAGGQDTLPGSPGRALIEKFVEHYAAAQDALEELANQ